MRLDYRETTERDVPPLAAAYRRRELHPQHAMEPRVVYVACDDGDVVGLIAGHLTTRFSCDGELEWIDVADAYRGRGIASQLLRRLATWFTAHQDRRICVDIAPDNAVARRFYRRHGAGELRPHWLAWAHIRTLIFD